MAEYDIAILGGGPGGYVAALHAGAKGARVALVERDRVGGTCVTVGCIPSKALLDSSHAYWIATHGEEHGVHVDGARFDLAKAVARKQGFQSVLVRAVPQCVGVWCTGIATDFNPSVFGATTSRAIVSASMT